MTIQVHGSLNILKGFTELVKSFYQTSLTEHWQYVHEPWLCVSTFYRNPQEMFDLLGFLHWTQDRIKKLQQQCALLVNNSWRVFIVVGRGYGWSGANFKECSVGTRELSFSILVCIGGLLHLTQVEKTWGNEIFSKWRQFVYNEVIQVE